MEVCTQEPNQANSFEKNLLQGAVGEKGEDGARGDRGTRGAAVGERGHHHRIS